MKVVLLISLFLAITSLSYGLKISYSFEEDACWLNFYERGAGIEPTQKSCRNGYELHNGWCFPQCSPGFVFDTEKEYCIQRCPEGLFANGDWCQTTDYYSRYSGYETSDECRKIHSISCMEKSKRYFPTCYGKDVKRADACFRDWFSKRSSEFPTLDCSEGLEMSGNLCYQPCSKGYRSDGSLCKNECPPGYNHCGHLCLPGKTCTNALESLTMKDLEAATINPSKMSEVLGSMTDNGYKFNHPICP